MSFQNESNQKALAFGEMGKTLARQVGAPPFLEPPMDRKRASEFLQALVQYQERRRAEKKKPEAIRLMVEQNVLTTIAQWAEKEEEDLTDNEILAHIQRVAERESRMSRLGMKEVLEQNLAMDLSLATLADAVADLLTQANCQTNKYGWQDTLLKDSSARKVMGEALADAMFPRELHDKAREYWLEDKADYVLLVKKMVAFADKLESVSPTKIQGLREVAQKKGKENRKMLAALRASAEAYRRRQADRRVGAADDRPEKRPRFAKKVRSDGDEASLACRPNKWPRQSHGKSGSDRAKRTVKCWVCKGPHLSRQCDAKIDPSEKDAKIAEGLNAMRAYKGNKYPKNDGYPCRKARIDDMIECSYALDSGCSDGNIVPKVVLDSLIQKGGKAEVQELENSVSLYLADHQEAEKLTQKAKFAKSCLHTAVGCIELRNGWFYVSTKVPELLIGSKALGTLGIDPQSALEAKIADGVMYIELEHPESLHRLAVNMISLAGKPATRIEAREKQNTGDSAEPLDVERYAQDFGKQSRRDLLEWAVKMADKAKSQGLSQTGHNRLTKMLAANLDLFRTVMSGDPPIKVEPMRTELKPGAVPYRCKPRHYTPEQQKFLEEMTETLEKHGLIYMNLDSKWASPVLVVRKPDGRGYRLCVDLREVNARCQPTVWPMPDIESMKSRLAGAKVFFSLDMFKGYWSMPLAKESQEIFSFMTRDKVFTPTRSIQGALNSALQFQSRMMSIFGEWANKWLCIWLDDAIAWAHSEQDLLNRLEVLFERARQVGVKFNIKKCVFFSRTLKWCGKIYSASGVRHDPARIEAIQEMPEPKTLRDLQQFIWAANWMRMSVPEYARKMMPLEVIKKKAEERQKHLQSRCPSAVKLRRTEWDAEASRAFENMRQALIKHVELAYPKEGCVVCCFPDASEHAWAAVITQIPEEDLKESDVSKQRHEPLAFLGKRFKGAELRWPIVEKEAAAIVMATERADYLLQTGKKFRLYTDHANLAYIFGRSQLKKHTAMKLERWAMHLQTFNYEIVAIAGDKNVWADLLTRWGCRPAEAAAIVARTTRMTIDDLRVTPKRHAAFVWPTEVEIRKLQEAQLTKAEKEHSSVDAKGLWRLRADPQKIVVPEQARGLQLRLMVVAHSGSAGHRAAFTTKLTLQQRYHWPEMAKQIEQMCAQCLHCITTRGGEKVPRPLGEAVHATECLTVLHMDFLYMEPLKSKEHNMKYVLVLKDDLSGYVRIIPSAEASSIVAAEAILQWIADFRTPEILVSDQGSHFTAEVISDLTRLRSMEHHLVTAYTPQANGTIERANRTIISITRAVLSEAQIGSENWPYLMPIVQHAINHARTERNDGLAPITVLLGQDPESPLDQILLPEVKEYRKVDVQKHVRRLRADLEMIHKKVVKKRDKRRKSNQRQNTGRDVQFIAGDWVLVAKVRRLPGDKLEATWKGPMRVIKHCSKYVYEIENPLTQERVQRHVQRLRIYAEADLELTNMLKDHRQHAEQRLEVEAIRELRYEEVTKQLELKVQWRGLEATWEPAQQIVEDVPQLVKRFLERLSTKHAHKEELQQLMRSVTAHKSR